MAVTWFAPYVKTLRVPWTANWSGVAVPVAGIVLELLVVGPGEESEWLTHSAALTHHRQGDAVSPLGPVHPSRGADAGVCTDASCSALRPFSFAGRAASDSQKLRRG